MQFAATWMDLEIVILSEVREISYDITYMWTLKRNYTNVLIYKTETDSDMENRLVVAKGEGVREGWSGSLGLRDANYYI